MQLIVSLALSVSVSFANEIYRSSSRTNRVAFAPLAQPQLSPRAQAAEDARALHLRMRELLAKKELQFMMIFPTGASAEIMDYALNFHAMMPPEFAGLTVADLAELEALIARRFGLPPARVAREVDVLIELARLNLKKTNALAIQAVLKQNSPTLGAAFQDLFVAELKLLEAPRGVVAGDLPTLAITASVYKNLTRHLTRALASSRRLLRKRPPSDVGQAWLHIDPPAPIVADAAQTLPADVLDIPLEAALVVNPDDIRAFVEHKGCGSFLERAEDPAVLKANTDGR